jgi:hypothetical protein
MFMKATVAIAAAVRRAVITGGSLEAQRLTPRYQGAPQATLVRKDEAVSELDEALSSCRCHGLATTAATEFSQN